MDRTTATEDGQGMEGGSSLFPSASIPTVAVPQDGFSVTNTNGDMWRLFPTRPVETATGKDAGASHLPPLLEAHMPVYPTTLPATPTVITPPPTLMNPTPTVLLPYPTVTPPTPTQEHLSTQPVTPATSDMESRSQGKVELVFPQAKQCAGGCCGNMCAPTVTQSPVTPTQEQLNGDTSAPVTTDMVDLLTPTQGNMLTVNGKVEDTGRGDTVTSTFTQESVTVAQDVVVDEGDGVQVVDAGVASDGDVSTVRVGSAVGVVCVDDVSLVGGV